jgi:transposase
MLQINWGLLTDARGCPIAVSVFEGNTADPTTLLPQVEKVREQFAIATLVMVGDRGMISETQIDALKQSEGVHWITALRNGAIVKLADSGQLQLGLFDERNLFTLTHPDFPDERLVVCRNGELAKQRTAKRQDLIAATERQLEKVKSMVENGRLKGRAAIGVRVGKVVNNYKVAKHFDLDINDNSFSYSVNRERVAAEAALDGIYVVRTSVPAPKMSSEEAVLNYKSLSTVERAFRTMKGVDLHVRPIRHHLENRVRAHIFLSMLAYYEGKTPGSAGEAVAV